MIYIARLDCGCAIDFHPQSNDSSDVLWLHSARGNGWCVECVSLDTPIQFDCDVLKQTLPRHTLSLFGDIQ